MNLTVLFYCFLFYSQLRIQRLLKTSMPKFSILVSESHSFPGPVMAFHEDLNYLLGICDWFSYSVNSFDETVEITSCGHACFSTSTIAVCDCLSLVTSEVGVVPRKTETVLVKARNFCILISQLF